MQVVGVDGIRGGWLLAFKSGPDLRLARAEGFAAVLELARKAAVIAIDMPIGLLDTAARGGRECERLARRLLGRGRTSCVYPAPCRPALAATSHAEAVARSRASSTEQVGISRQCFGLFEKLRDLDRTMTPELQERCVEVHPEVSFTALRDALTAAAASVRLQPKRTREGRNQRLQLLRLAGFAEIDALLRPGRDLGAQTDDVLDACVAAWTAERLTQGRAGRLPCEPPVDARGRRMEIWF